MTLAALLALAGANRPILANAKYTLSQALLLLFPQLQAAPSVSGSPPTAIVAQPRENLATLGSRFARVSLASEGSR